MATVRITLNGESREIPEGTTVLKLLETLELRPERVAVELDRRILRRPEFGETVLEPGAQVEIVHFVGGG